MLKLDFNFGDILEAVKELGKKYMLLRIWKEMLKYTANSQRVDGHSTKLEKYMKTIIMALLYIL